MNVGPTATKKNVLEQLLDQGMVLVALDARVDGVDVPAHLRKDPQLRLNLSYRFGLPMTVDEWGVAATLTFAGVPYNCRFPWTAIFLMVSHVSGQPYLFPDDIPAELLSQAPEMANVVQQALPNAKTISRPKLTLVPASESGARSSESPPTPATETTATPAAATLTPPENVVAPTEPPPAAAGDEEDSPRPRRPRRRGHLRLVK